MSPEKKIKSYQVLHTNYTTDLTIRQCEQNVYLIVYTQFINLEPTITTET